MSGGGFRPCALVPVYNHGSTAGAVVAALAAQKLPVILVDDGSDARTRDLLSAIAGRTPGCALFTMPRNQGKGAAVSLGLRQAAAAGYSHALQVDADLQHDLADVPRFLQAAREKPEALVSGNPRFDASLPRGRRIGRKITGFWVAVETLSRDIPEAMCGFRVYPLAPVCALLSGRRLNRRMGFDIEVLVRLHWRGLPMRFLPTRVVYPPGGLSNFRMVRDNLAITLVHTRLFLGLLARLPLLLARGRRRAGEHWSRQKEKGGGLWQLRLMLALYRWLGARRIRAFLYPVVGFFFLFSPALRGISRRFLCRVSALQGASPPGAQEVFRHLFSFSFALVEKISAWSRDMSLARLSVKTADAEELVRQVKAGQGAFLICSHLGNAEMLRALASTEVARALPGFRITSIVDFSGTARFNRLLAEIDPVSMLRLVPASEVGADTIIILKERIAAGELVIIAGDRTSAHGGGLSEVRFLGQPAWFPRGAFILASLLEAPVYFMFAVREQDGDFDSPYGFHVHRAATEVSGSRRERQAKIQALVAEFAARLEALCLAHPYQWYNFYDFWKKPSTEGAAPRGARKPREP